MVSPALCQHACLTTEIERGFTFQITPPPVSPPRVLILLQTARPTSNAKNCLNETRLSGITFPPGPVQPNPCTSFPGAWLDTNPSSYKKSRPLRPLAGMVAVAWEHTPIPIPVAVFVFRGGGTSCSFFLFFSCSCSCFCCCFCSCFRSCSCPCSCFSFFACSRLCSCSCPCCCWFFFFSCS